MDGVVHNPDNLQFSNEEDLLMRVNTVNSVEHNFYMERMAENQEVDVQVLFFLPIYIQCIYLLLPQLLSTTIAISVQPMN